MTNFPKSVDHLISQTPHLRLVMASINAVYLYVQDDAIKRAIYPENDFREIQAWSQNGFTKNSCAQSPL